MNITITLTAAQEKGLAYVAASPQEWAENAVHNDAELPLMKSIQQKWLV